MAHTCFYAPSLYPCKVAKNHFVSGGQARIGRPKIPLGSGSIEASPVIQCKDAIKARVSTAERARRD